MVQMVEDAYRAALAFGNSLLLLDRYFLTVPALKKLSDSWNSFFTPGIRRPSFDCFTPSPTRTWLDRYFLTVPALKKLGALNSSGDVRMEIITKAKKSCTAFEKPSSRRPGRGRPPKKGGPSWSRMLKGMQAQFRTLPARMPSPPNICPWMYSGFAEFSDSAAA